MNRGTETVGLSAPEAQGEPAEADRPGPPTPESTFGYHAALDGLRAIAVLSVIAYHDNYAWAKGGFLGVDMFFVLSGFLITTLLVLEFRRAATIHLAAFWARRARRLLPALFVVLVFVAIYNHYAVLPWERNGVRNDMFASLFYVANWRFIFDQQGYFQLFSAASPLRHMWSLAIEEQYYLVWPLIVLACLRLGRGSTRLLAWVCALGAIASIVSMQLRFHPGDPSAAYYATDARAHSILIGALPRGGAARVAPGTTRAPRARARRHPRDPRRADRDARHVGNRGALLPRRLRVVRGRRRGVDRGHPPGRVRSHRSSRGGRWCGSGRSPTACTCGTGRSRCGSCRHASTSEPRR